MSANKKSASNMPNQITRTHSAPDNRSPYDQQQDKILLCLRPSEQAGEDEGAADGEPGLIQLTDRVRGDAEAVVATGPANSWRGRGDPYSQPTQRLRDRSGGNNESEW